MIPFCRRRARYEEKTFNFAVDGSYYVESRTRSMGRTDVIVDYLGKQYVIEMKIWRGNEYNERGERQLEGYLDDYNLKRGYMISFNFNKLKGK